MPIRKQLLALTTVLTLSLAQAGFALAHSDHDHHHHGDPGELKVELNQGQKWQTDAPLRRGMAAIRDEVAALLPSIHNNTLPEQDYAALATRLQGHMHYMFDNCDLPPEADAQLHAVLAQILHGMGTMSEGEQARSGAVRIVRSLEAYAAHFEHPGWPALRH